MQHRQSHERKGKERKSDTTYLRTIDPLADIIHKKMQRDSYAHSGDAPKKKETAPKKEKPAKKEPLPESAEKKAETLEERVAVWLENAAKAVAEKCHQLYVPEMAAIGSAAIVGATAIAKHWFGGIGAWGESILAASLVAGVAAWVLQLSNKARNAVDGFLAVEPPEKG